jgi:hypothetical protein
LRKIIAAGPGFPGKLARNKLIPEFMDTMMWEILAGILIFAAANMAYFEIRRLIQLLRGYFNKSKSLPDH